MTHVKVTEEFRRKTVKLTPQCDRMKPAKKPGHLVTSEPTFLREKTSDYAVKNINPPIKYWEPHEIKIKLYLRECERLKVIPISTYIRHPTNTVLKLKHYNIGPNGAKALAAALLLDSVVSYLDIEGNSITSYGLSSIKESLSDNTHITYLNIADNKLGSRGAQQISSMMMHNHCIETLDASKNGFKDSDADEFARILHENRTLKELILSGNEFEEHAGTEFGAAIASNDSLEKLDLSWNHIRRRGAADFANGIKENVSIKKLDVSFNGFGTEGAVCMGQALGSNRTLLELDMSKNRITHVDLQLFIKQMGQNDTLQVLRLEDNLINALSAMELLRSVMALETSSIQVLDFGTLSVDQCFLMVLKELQEVKDVKVKHGRIQNVYLDRDMMPLTENPEQDLTDFDPLTPAGISTIDIAEKGKTYVVENELDKNTEEGDTKTEGDSEVNDNKDDKTESGAENEMDGKTGTVNKEDNSESVVDFDEKKLDDEVEAVTGKPSEPQKPLADDKGSAGTLTPDI